MAAPVLQTSFTAGEVAPELWGQVDLRRYQTGLAVARNYWTNYRGGQISRPGTSLAAVSLPLATEDPPCLMPFVYSQEQSYILEFTDSAANGKIMRIFYRGEPIRDDPLGLISVTADVGGAEFDILDSTSDGWAVGERIYFAAAGGLAKPNGVSGVNLQTFTLDSNPGVNRWILRDINGALVTALTWSAYTAGGLVSREVWVAHPWDGSVLFDLKYAQSADVLTVTHRDYPVQLVSRLSQRVWTVAPESFGTSLTQPTGQAVTAVGNLTAEPQFWYGYIVTANNTGSGQQSSPGDTFISTVNSALNQNEGTANSITWNAVSGANLYRIYKAQTVPNGYQGSPPYTWGLVGQTESNSFVDSNLEADYTLVPPSNRLPFSGGPITGTAVTPAGFGYINPQVIVSDVAGEGANITATVTASGAVNTPMTIVDGGEDYQAPGATIVEDRSVYTGGTGLTFSFSDAWVVNSRGPTYWQPAPGSITISTGGSSYHVPRIVFKYSGGGITSMAQDGIMYGTTAAAVVTATTQLVECVALSAGAPAGGTMNFEVADQFADSFDYSRATGYFSTTQSGDNYPGCVAFYQQRRVFASSTSSPSTFWMSRPGQFRNYDVSYPTQSDDAVTGTVVAGEINQIVSLTPVNIGVIALTAGGAFLISGDGKQAPVTPATVNARTQTFAGAAPLQPLRVADNLVYLTAQKSAVRDLQYDFFTDIYKGSDLSVLSSHLFNGRDIVQWAWAPEPFKAVQAVRDDGILLTLIYLKEQEVVGWTRSDTNGQFVGVASIPEGRENGVYVAVRRYIFGTGYRYFIERFASRDFGQNVALNVPSDPELAWCVDAGARYPLTYPSGTLTSFGFTLGALTNPVLVAGGAGFPADPFVQVLDDGGTGTGGEVSVTVTDGQITAVALVSAGSGYTRPRVLVGGGHSAVIEISFQNLAYFETTGGTPWASGDVGKVLRVGGGKGTVLRYLAGAPALIEVRMDKQVAGRVPNEPAFVLPPTPTGQWSLTTPVTAVGGLEHLEGCTVQIVADGSVVTPQTVVGGCITLPVAATAITAGQGFTTQFQTLRPADPTVQGRRRTVNSVTLRVVDTRGLAVGNSFDDLVEIKQRNDSDNYGQPIEFQIGGGSLPQSFGNAPLAQDPIGYEDLYANLGGGWDTQGHVCILQSYPLPSQILATVSEVTVGDTPG